LQWVTSPTEKSNYLHFPLIHSFDRTGEVPMSESRSDAREEAWTSLDKTKLAIDILKALASIVVSWAIFWFGQNYEQISQRQIEESQRLEALTTQRVKLWDKVAIDINNIYCYFLFVGNWKTSSPEDIILAKRNVDQIMFSYRPFFSDKFFDAYQKFMDSAFKTYTGFGLDARLRTAPVRPLDDPGEKDRFTGEDNRLAVHDNYYELLRMAGDEFDVDIGKTPPAPQKPVPAIKQEP
jgi:hypothetical protein